MGHPNLKHVLCGLVSEKALTDRKPKWGVTAHKNINENSMLPIYITSMFVLQQRENQELFRGTLSPVEEKLESIFLNYKAKNLLCPKVGIF